MFFRRSKLAGPVLITRLLPTTRSIIVRFVAISRLSSLLVAGTLLNMSHAATDVVMKTSQHLIIILLGYIFLVGCSERESKPRNSLVTLHSAKKVITAALARPETTTIHIDQKPVSDGDLELIRENPNITNLLLDESRVTDSGISVIATLPNLMHLRVRSKLTDACIDDLLQIKSLQFLNLPFADFTDQGLIRLATHPRIQLLRLRSPRVTDASLPAVAAMKNLAFLHFIEIPVTDTGLESFFDNDQLQSLYLDDSRTTDEGLSALLVHQPLLHLHINQAHLDNDPNKGHHEQ